MLWVGAGSADATSVPPSGAGPGSWSPASPRPRPPLISTPLSCGCSSLSPPLCQPRQASLLGLAPSALPLLGSTLQPFENSAWRGLLSSTDKPLLILCSSAQRSELCDIITSSAKPQGGVGGFLGEGAAGTKALGQECASTVSGAARRPVQPEQRGQGERGREVEVCGPEDEVWTEQVVESLRMWLVHCL